MSLTRVSYSMLGAGNQVSPDDFGATGGADDTAAVQAAFDSGKNVQFTRSYNVTSVTDSGDQREIDFNGFILVGIATVATDCVLLKRSFHTDMFDVRISATTTVANRIINDNYYCAMRWVNTVTAGTQYNNIHGMFIYYMRRGLIYGANSGNPPGGIGPHSENSIYGYRTRGVEFPFVGNANAGVIDFHGSTFVNIPNEWTALDAFSILNSRAIINIACITSVLGGELQTAAQDPAIAINGCADLSNIRFFGTRVETAPTMNWVGGEVHFIGCEIQNTKDSISLFTASSSGVGTLGLTDCNTYRTAGVGAYSSSPLVNTSGLTSGSLVVTLANTKVDEWKWPLLSIGKGSLLGTKLMLTITVGDATYVIDNARDNILERSDRDTIGYQIVGWYGVAFGGGTQTFTIAADGPPYGNLASSFALTTDGEYRAYSSDQTSAATIQATSFIVKPGQLFEFEANIKRQNATSSGSVFAEFYGTNGVSISALEIVPNTSLVIGSWVPVTSIFTIPASTAYMSIYVRSTINGGQSLIKFADTTLRYA